MSTPMGGADNQKKKRGGTKRRNAAASNPPQNTVVAAVEPPRKISQANHLLAQLAVAQGLPVPPIPQEQPSTSKISAPKQKENNNKNQKQSKTEDHRGKGESVGARMSAKQQPPQLNQRSRKISQNYMPKQQPQSDPVYRGPKIPEDVLDSISFRFIMNIPDSERLDETRVCFQIELAHWFYIDFYVNQEEQRADCINIGMRDFLKQIFAHNDFLRCMYHRSDQILDNWRTYKSTVPTYGGILLDSTLNHILLVQGFYASKNSWGFPKGKVNESESPRACAIREVREETGFDFGEHSQGKEFKIQKMVNDTMIRLYVVKDVPMDYKFEPQTRCEIRKMKWFNIWDLPTDRNDQFAANKGFQPRHFYGVVPFVQDLQNYVKREEKRREKEGKGKKEKGITLNNGKKNSAFTKVEKKSPSERVWMESVASSGSWNEQKGVEVATPVGETLFKPLGETGGAPPGSNLAMILAHSSGLSTSSKGSSSKTPVAHPVAIRPCDHPVYEAAKEDKRKPIPGTSLSSSLWSALPPSSSTQSASQIEDALNKLLFTAPLDSRPPPLSTLDGHHHHHPVPPIAPLPTVPPRGHTVAVPPVALPSTLPLYNPLIAGLMPGLIPQMATTVPVVPTVPPSAYPLPPHPGTHPSHDHHSQQRDSSLDGDEEVKQCVPTLSQEPSLPPLADLCISSDGVYPSGLMDLPSTSSHQSGAEGGYRRDSIASSIMSPAMKGIPAGCGFELVPAWKGFKLNRELIFEEISRFM